MIVKTLVENMAISSEFQSEHGLSLYIETKRHKLLFDMGASTLFAENAKKLGVDLTAIDLAVISHGHYDHGGGLQAFMRVNSKAKIYLSKKAFGKYYANREDGRKVYIGLDVRLMDSDRFIYVGDQMAVDEGLFLFANVDRKRLNPSGNQDLFMANGTALVHDDFAHEQHLLIKEDGKSLLVAGCAHCGIVNIIEHLHTNFDILPSHVIGGFHLHNPSANADEDSVVISQLAEYLKHTGTKYNTCHCTGVEPYKRLKQIMGEDMHYLASGSQLNI